MAFFACLFAIYSVFSWLPTMLVAEGLRNPSPGLRLTAYNLGGVFGALLCAQFITRFGSRWPMIVCAAGGLRRSCCSNWSRRTTTTLIVVTFGLHGLFVNAVNCTLYAVSAFLYPTDIRATGTATALAVGRLGAILSAFVGAALITAGGASAFLNALGLAMIVVVVALGSLRHHIAPTVGYRPSCRSDPAGTVRGRSRSAGRDCPDQLRDVVAGSVRPGESSGGLQPSLLCPVDPIHESISQPEPKRRETPATLNSGEIGASTTKTR